MADTDSTNTAVKTTPTGDLAGLAARLAEHADSIENLAAREMAQDMASAARAIDRLVAGLRTAVESTTDEVTRHHLLDLVRGAPEPIKGPPELVSVTSIKALLNRLLDHGQASGDEAVHHDIETVGRLVFTLWEIIERAGIKDPAIDVAAEGRR